MDELDRFNGSALRAERARKGWSQTQLAQYSAVSVQTIKRLESKTSPIGNAPGIELIQRLASALKVPWILFFDMEDT